MMNDVAGVFSTLLNDFHFMYPHWLWLLLLLPLLVWRITARQRNQGSWAGIVDEQLAPFVLTGRDQPHRLHTALVIVLLSALAIIALAGPAWEKKAVPAFRKQQAVVVALDLSASMYARDLTPNRLDAARFKLLDLLKTRQDGQTGLVVFAGDAFIVSPLTDDTETIAAQVKNLSPEIMPAQGSQLDLAIIRAQATLDQATPGNGHILLMADGVTDVGLAQQAAKQAFGRGYTVSVLSIGTDEGAPIPMSNGGFLTDASGKTVLPRLDAAALRSVAVAGQGLFVRNQMGDQDIGRLNAHWTGYADSSELLAGDDRKLDDWFNQGIWLVLLLVPLAMLFFRRGWLAAWVLVIVLPQAELTEASVWNDLWLTPDQQGQRALQDGDAATASELFSDPNWKATAAYRAGDYAQAAELYAGSETVDGLYNYGNALARQGKLAEAIAAFEEVLARNPEHEDARHNRDVLKAEQEKQKKQQQQDQQGQQGEQNPQNSQNQNSDTQQGNEGESSGSNQQNNQAGQQQQSAAQEPSDDQPAQNESEAGEQQPEEAEQNQAQGQQDSPAEAMDAQTREQKQATEQWLRRIPDDPAGLWRRKFQYQYRQRARQQQQGGAW